MRYSSTLFLVAAVAGKILADEACSPLHFIYGELLGFHEPETSHLTHHVARATTEPAETANIWSKGYGAAGTSIFTNVTKLIPETTGYSVHYPVRLSACKYS